LARAFKSPPFVVIATLLQSRSTIKAKAKLAMDRSQELERENQQLLARNRQLGDRLIQAQEHAQRMQQQRDEARGSVNLPNDPSVGTHGYGPIMIALAVNLAMSIGFRAAARAIRIFYDAFGLQKEITSSHDSIRNWSMRLGIAAMNQGRERILSAKSRVIMVDHSCQMGDAKLMVVLGLDADHLPEPGQALRREDMKVLEVNQVKSILGKDEKFQQVISQMGTTRSQVQQIELAFLSPPTKFGWIEGFADQIPMWHRIPTPASVRASFAEVTKKQAAEWVTTHVGCTLTSQRRAAYAEHSKAIKGATSTLVLT